MLPFVVDVSSRGTDDCIGSCERTSFFTSCSSISFCLDFVIILSSHCSLSHHNSSSTCFLSAIVYLCCPLDFIVLVIHSSDLLLHKEQRTIDRHRHHDPCTHCIVDLERLVFGEVEQLIEHCLDDSGIPVYLTGHCPLEYCSTCFVHIDVEPEACIGPIVSLSIAIEFCRSLIHVECLMQIVISV